jgi:uncharacterized membrane protein
MTLNTTINRRKLIAPYALAVLFAIGNMSRQLAFVTHWITPLIMVTIGACAFILTYRISLRTVGAIVVILVIIFLCEASGANFGFPFGDFAFTNLLGPKLLDVPLVILFTWLAILIPAWTAAGKFLRYKHVVIASILVTAFDGVLEFAADSLDLWHWKGGLPTELNYISWFGVAYVSFSILTHFAGEKEPSPLVPHLLYAQLLYFILSDAAIRFLSPHF